MTRSSAIDANDDEMKVVKMQKTDMNWSSDKAITTIQYPRMLSGIVGRAIRHAELVSRQSK